MSTTEQTPAAAPEATAKPKRTRTPKRTPIKPSGAFKGNALSEAWNRGEKIEAIASETGLSAEDVAKRLDAHSKGFATVEAYVASLATPKPKPRAARGAVAKAKPAKPAAPPSRTQRGDDFNATGIRLIGLNADGTAVDLGAWGGGPVPFADAVDAYEASGDVAKFPDYLAVPQRNVWHVAPKS